MKSKLVKLPRKITWYNKNNQIKIQNKLNYNIK